MASNRGLKPRGSPFAFGTHLMLTLLTFCLFFEILRLLTFTSATSIDHLAQRREDSGSNDSAIYQGVIDTSIDAGDNTKRDFGENVKAAFDDLGNKIESIFHPSDKKETPVEAVSEYAYDQLNQQIPLKDLKKAFEKTYGEIQHSGNKQADDGHWILDQAENVIPQLKKKYDEANKSVSTSEHHERDTGGDLKPTSKDIGIRTGSQIVSDGQAMDPVSWMSEYAYDVLGHHVPLEELKPVFQKSYDAIEQKDSQTAVADEPQLKKKYGGDHWTYVATTHNGRDAGDNPPQMPRGDDYYTGPHFFPYPTAPIPAIPDELKASLADAFNKWQAIAHGTHSHYDKGIAACDTAEAITAKGDPTSMAKRREIVEACINFLIDHPSGLGKYHSENALEPYLTEFVDKGKIKDEDGKIKKFYKRGQINTGVYVAPKPALSQDFLDILTTAYKKYKEDLANRSHMSCPLTKENACGNPNLAVTAVPDSTNQKSLETCIVFLGWHPNCLRIYESKDFIKPYLEDLANSGKIDGSASNSSSTGNDHGAAVQGLAGTLLDLLGSANSESMTPDTQDVAYVGIQSRDFIASGQESGTYEEMS